MLAGSGGNGCQSHPGVRATYGALPTEARRVCRVHLLRDFTRWSEPGGHSGSAIATGGDAKAVAERVLALGRRFRAGEIDRPALRAAVVRLRARMGQVLCAGAKLDKPRDAGVLPQPAGDLDVAPDEVGSG